MGKLCHAMEMKQAVALHQRQIRPGIHCLVNAVELGRIVEVRKDVLVTMCPLMGGRTRLLPDQKLEQRYSMCDLAPLGLSVLGARRENCRNAPRSKAARDVSVQLKP